MTSEVKSQFRPRECTTSRNSPRHIVLFIVTCAHMTNAAVSIGLEHTAPCLLLPACDETLLVHLGNVK